MPMRGCPPEVTPAVRAALVAAIRAGYAEADGLYQPDHGVGDRVHAITVYDVVTWHLQQLAHPGVRFESIGWGPELRVGELRVRWNKVGDGSETINSSFPRPSRAAALMAAGNQQLSLWSQPDGEDAQPVNWILCHVGNPRDSLRAVYLAAPIETDGDRITGWRTVVPIWSATQPDVEFPDAPPIELPASIPLPELEIAFVPEQAEADAAD